MSEMIIISDEALACGFELLKPLMIDSVSQAKSSFGFVFFVC